jgi:hypothetical protein
MTRILDTNTMRRVQRHLLRAFDLDEAGARAACESLVRRVLDDLTVGYAERMGRHIDAVIELRTRLADIVDAATRGETPADNVDALLTELQEHLDALLPLRLYLEDNPPAIDADGIRAAVADVPRTHVEPEPVELDPSSTVRVSPRARDARTGSRLSALRTRITSWRDRIALDLPQFAGVRDAVLADLTALRDRFDRGEYISEGEIEELEGLVDSINQGIRDTTRPVRRRWLDAMEARLNERLAELRTRLTELEELEEAAEGVDEIRERREEIDDLRARVAEVEDLRRGLARLRAQPGPGYHPGPDYARLRRHERLLDRREGEVYVDLSDPVVRARLQAWFTEYAAPLLSAGPVGEYLHRRLMDSLATRSELILRQSPRSDPRLRTMTTDQLQRVVLEHLHELPPEYVVAFLDAALGQPDGWPRTSDGRVWEVDHVDELWTGGADEAPNLLALPPGLHRQHDEAGAPPAVDLSKTGLMAAFRRAFRDALRVEGEDVDIRAVDFPEDDEP